MLATKAIASLDSSKDTIVEVVEYNEKTISFYKKFGFVKFEKGNGHEVTSGKIMPTIRMKWEKVK